MTAIKHVLSKSWRSRMYEDPFLLSRLKKQEADNQRRRNQQKKNMKRLIMVIVVLGAISLAAFTPRNKSDEIESVRAQVISNIERMPVGVTLTYTFPDGQVVTKVITEEFKTSNIQAAKNANSFFAGCGATNCWCGFECDGGYRWCYCETEEGMIYWFPYGSC